jgi:hypothetical protein
MYTVGISMRDRCSKALEGRKNSVDFFQGRHGVQILVCKLLHGSLKVTDIPVRLLIDLHTLVYEIFFFPKRHNRYFPKLHERLIKRYSTDGLQSHEKVPSFVGDEVGIS